MENEIASSNVSFSFLKGSSDFLNMIINNISSCILLLNNEMELIAFNDPLKSIFCSKPDEHIYLKKCGNVLGCAFAVEEEKECGQTSQCKTCEIRKAALYCYLDDKHIFKSKFSRYFYKDGNSRVLKHLQFSTRSFYFEKDKYIILIIEDITQHVNNQEIINKQISTLETLKAKGYN